MPRQSDSTRKRGTKPTATKSRATAKKPRALLREEQIEAEGKWSPPETQKTEEERSISRIGASVPDSLKHDMTESNRRERKLIARGPDGPPVRDQLGYEMDRDRIIRASRRITGRSVRTKRHMAYLDKMMDDTARIEDIMGDPDEKGRGVVHKGSIYQDQVACDLDIPYHTVVVPDYEERRRRGFKLDPKRWLEEPSEEERERMYTLAVGSAFRI